eukprot:1417562-Pleurochrysis_carterae.AAC.1
MAPGEKLAVEDVRVGWSARFKAKLVARRICGAVNRVQNLKKPGSIGGNTVSEKSRNRDKRA